MSRVATWDSSSTITVVFGAMGWSRSCETESGDRLRVEPGGAQLGRRPCGWCHDHDHTTGRRQSGGGCRVEGGGLAEPGGGGRPPARTARHRTTAHRWHLIFSQLFGFGQRSPSSIHGETAMPSAGSVAGRARARRRSSTARSSTVDHCGGRRPTASGARRTNVFGTQELSGDAEDLFKGEPARRDRCDPLNDVGLTEARFGGTQPGRRIDQRREHLLVAECWAVEASTDDQVVDPVTRRQPDRLGLRRSSGPAAVRA